MAAYLLLTSSIFGAQILWTTEQALGSPYLASLGLSKHATALVWLAGPLSGLVAQPLVGILADSSTSSYRRRAPMVFSCLAASLSLALLVLFPHPSVAVLAFYLLDFALNAYQSCARALILDRVPAPQQSNANAAHGYMTHLGTLAAYIVAYTAPSFPVVCFIGALILVISTIVTTFTQPESPRTPSCPSQPSSAYHYLPPGISDIPSSIWRVYLVQFFAWTAWFPFLFYASTFIAQAYTASHPEESFSSIYSYNNDPLQVTARVATPVLFLGALVSVFSGTFLPPLASLLSKKQYYCAARLASPRSLWTMSLVLLGSLLIGSLSIPYDDYFAASAIIVAAGIPWCIACWVPYALLMEYARHSPVNSADSNNHTTNPLQETSPLLNKPIDGQEPQNGGLIIGIHNIFIVMPQFIVSIIASLIFKSLNSNPIPSSSSSISSPHQSQDVAYVFAFGGVASIIAACLSLFLPITRSESLTIACSEP